jgi:hypothetical protein
MYLNSNHSIKKLEPNINKIWNDMKSGERTNSNSNKNSVSYKSQRVNEMLNSISNLEYWREEIRIILANLMINAKNHIKHG